MVIEGVADEHLGESGYVLEAHLFGGVLGWGHNVKPATQARLGTFRAADPGCWSEADVSHLFLRRGNVGDTEIFVISERALFIIIANLILPGSASSVSFRENGPRPTNFSLFEYRPTARTPYKLITC